MTQQSHYWIFIYLFIFKDFTYLFMRDTHREREGEAETQTEGEADSTQGARHKTRSQDPRIKPWAEGCTKLLRHTGFPLSLSFVDIPCLNNHTEDFLE